MTSHFNVVLDARTRLADAVYHLCVCCTDVSLECVDEAPLLAWCCAASKTEPKATRTHRRSAVVDIRISYLLVECHEHRKGLNRFEFFRFLENVHEHLSRLFDATGLVHVFCSFIVARDIHEVIVREQDGNIIHASAVWFGTESMKLLRPQYAPQLIIRCVWVTHRSHQGEFVSRPFLVKVRRKQLVADRRGR
jgi:hypothetical protein